MSDMVDEVGGGAEVGGSSTSSAAPQPVLTYEQQEAQRKRREAKASEIITKRDQWRRERQPYEQEWFVNAAFEAGNHYVRTNPATGGLQSLTPKTPDIPTIKVNRLQAKIRARRAKFRKNRPRIVIVPATLDFDDHQNAQLTQKLIDYLWRKLQLEKAYYVAQGWAEIASKGFWWYHWDAAAARQVQIPGEGGLPTQETASVGDIMVEPSSPFEVLVGDPAVSYIGDQVEIIRVKMRDFAQMKEMFKDQLPPEASGTARDNDAFRVEQRIAGLNPMSVMAGTAGRPSTTDGKWILVTEYFKRPSAEAPQGEYVVLVGEHLVAEGPLPYGFHDLPNPFPVTEFPDMRASGRFWSTTMISQLVPLQQELNFLRTQLSIHAKKNTHPKWRAAKQQQLNKGALTGDGAEVLEYTAVPNIEPPTPITAPQISNDLWRAIDLIKADFDEVSQIYPQSEGKVGSATSGFQTNLLQEATETVHSSDIREHELAIEEAAIKLRRMVKMGYQEDRIISTVGSGFAPDVFVFSSDNVDENANLIVEVGSGLPTLKAAKQESVLALFREGLLGDPADPQIRQRALGMLELGTTEDAFDVAKADDREAELENQELKATGQIPPVHFWQNHQGHYAIHALALKSPAWRTVDEATRKLLVAHMLFHMRQINVDSAIKSAIDEGMPELVQALMPPQMFPPSPPPGGMVPPGPSGPPAAAPGAPPMAPPPPPPGA